MTPELWLAINAVFSVAIVVYGYRAMVDAKFPPSESFKVTASTAAVATLATLSFGEYGLFAGLTTMSFMTVATNYVMKVNSSGYNRYAMPKEDRIGMTVIGVVMLGHFWWLPPFFYGGLLWTICGFTLLFAAFAYRGNKPESPSPN